MDKKNQPKTLKRLAAFLKDRKKTVAFLLFLVTMYQAASIAVPFFSKTLIDALTKFVSEGGGLPLHTIIYAAIGILAMSLISSYLQSYYNYNLFQMATSLEDKIKNQALEKYLELHSLFHHGASSGQIIGRIDRGGTSIYTVIYDIIGQNFVPPIIIFLGAFTALLYSNAWIALALLIPFPIYILATRGIANRIYLIEQEANDAFEGVSKEMYDVASNVLTVKKFSQEEEETENNRNLLRSARKTQYGGERLWQRIENIQACLQICFFGIR